MPYIYIYITFPESTRALTKVLADQIFIVEVTNLPTDKVQALGQGRTRQYPGGGGANAHKGKKVPLPP